LFDRWWAFPRASSHDGKIRKPPFGRRAKPALIAAGIRDAEMSVAQKIVVVEGLKQVLWRVHAVPRVSFASTPVEILALIGPQGAGKKAPASPMLKLPDPFPMPAGSICSARIPREKDKRPRAIWRFGGGAPFPDTAKIPDHGRCDENVQA